VDDATQPATPTMPPATTSLPPGAGAAGGGDAQQGWLNTAPGGNQPAEAKQPQIETTDNLSGATLPKEATTNLQGLPVTSLKRGGLLGVVDNIADVLAGKQRPELGKDADGNLYVKQHNLTRGEQWMRIAGEAIHGAAAGLAAGKGAGNMGKAPLAGIEAGEKDQAAQKQNAQDMSDQVDKQKLAKANNQMLQMKMAAQAWQQTQEKVKAGQESVKFNDEQIKELTDHGGILVGTAAHAADIGEILKVQPDVMSHLVQKGTLQIRKNMDEDGNVLGIKAYIMPESWAGTYLPPGTVGKVFNSVTGQIEDFNYSDGTTAGVKAVHDTAAITAKDEFDAKKRKAEKDAADLEKTRQETATSKAEEGRVPHENRKDDAEAGAAQPRSAQIKTGVLTADGTPNPRFEEMAQAMERGDILPTDLKREAKGAGLDPNELVGRAAEIAHANGREFSLPIIEQEHKFASNVKTQAALDGIDRVVGSPGSPGYIDQMLDTARQANLMAGWGAGAANNVVLATQRYFGGTAARNLQTRIMDTRRSIASLIGNPLLGGGETDQKLKQADEMLGQSPTMENLEGASTILKQALQTQKQSIVGNNRYLRTRYGSAGATVTMKAPNGQTQQVPAAQVEHYKSLGAQVVQQ
jgi:hypothetical protein